MKFLKMHYTVQQGMYFDECIENEDYAIFLSKIVEDSFWNYSVLKNESDIETTILKIENAFKKVDRNSCIYLFKNNYEKKLYDMKYELINTETWMIYKQQNVKQVSHNVIKVENEKQKQDFLEVFRDAYGGEVTPDNPYGDLSKSYYDALDRTFENNNFVHFILYDNEIPASIATICNVDNNMGIYNVGTKQQYRKKGYATQVTNACINYAINNNYNNLFLQTEPDSNVEKLYRNIGFERIFLGYMYEKRK